MNIYHDNSTLGLFLRSQRGQFPPPPCPRQPGSYRLRPCSHGISSTTNMRFEVKRPLFLGILVLTTLFVAWSLFFTGKIEYHLFFSVLYCSTSTCTCMCRLCSFTRVFQLLCVQLIGSPNEAIRLRSIELTPAIYFLLCFLCLNC